MALDLRTHAQYGTLTFEQADANFIETQNAVNANTAQLSALTRPLADFQNWTLTSYTDETWTPVVPVDAAITRLVISNTSVDPVTVEIRGGGVSAVPPSVLEPGESSTADVGGYLVSVADPLELWADAAGISVLAIGVTL